MASASGAGCAVVRVAAHTLMILIQLRLIAVFMTARAAECGCGIAGVTLVARVPLVLIFVLYRSVNGESRGGIHIVHRSEGRGRRPGGLRVTGPACMGEIHRRVVRRSHGRSVVALVTLVTIGVTQLIIPVDVAIQTGTRDVRTLKRESG